MKTAQTGQPPRVLLVGFPKHIKGLINQELGGVLKLEFVDKLEPQSIPDPKSIYKTLFFLSVFAEDEIKNLACSFTKLDLDIILIIPHIPSHGGSKDEKIDPKLLSLWDWLLEKQRFLYKYVTINFPVAQLLFFEGLSLKGLPSSLPCLLLSQVESGVLFGLGDNKQPLSLILEQDFCSVIVDYLKKPFQPSGVLIKSTIISTGDFLNKTRDIYHNLSQKQLNILHQPIKLSEKSLFISNTRVLPGNKDILSYARLYGGGLFKTAAMLNPLFERSVATTKSADTHTASPLAFGQQLSAMFNKTRIKQKQDHFKNIAGVEKKMGKKNIGRKVFFLGGLISAFISIYLMFAAAKFYFFYQQFFSDVTEFFSNNLIKPEYGDPKWEAIKQKNKYVRGVVSAWGNLLSHPILDQAELVGIATDQLEKYFDNILVVNDQKELIYQYILSQSTLDFFETLSKFESAQEDLVVIEAKLTELINQLGFFTDRPGVLDKYTQIVKDRTQEVGLYQLFRPKLNDILGFTSQKNYIIVFQDSAELRPTGGFITSLLLLRFGNGQLSSYQAKTAYEVSNLLSGAVVPPPSLNKALGESSWYFHDSNWEPNFPTTAKTMGWFVGDALGFKPDGVLGLNTESLRSLLGSVEQLELQEYNELVTADNLVSLLDKYAQKGVKESQDFTSSLLSALVGRVFSQTPANFGLFVSALTQGLNDNQIQLEFSDDEIQTILTNVGWSGALPAAGCLAQFTKVGCVGDGVYQVEANVGVNRVNTNVETVINDRVKFSSDRVSRTRAVTWHNHATSNIWPKGAYKAYIRWYLPKNALFDDLIIDGKSQVSSGAEINIENDRLVVALLINVNPGSELKADLIYHLPINLSAQKAYMYANQSQPGKLITTHQLILDYPPSWRLSKIAPNPDNQVEGHLEFSLSQEKTRLMGVEFASTD